MDFYRSKQPLTDEAIYSILKDVTEKYKEAVGKQAMDETKFMLAFEELLIQFRDCYGTEKPSEVAFVKRFGKFSIELSQEGEKQPWANSDSDDDFQMSANILEGMGISPRYTYSSFGKGLNRVIWESIVVHKKHTMLLSIVIAVVLAVAAGIAIIYAPENIHNSLVKDVITPVFTKLTSIFAAVATPLVFFAVIGGIVGIGDVKSFGQIGSKVLSRMMGSYVIAVVCMGVGGVLFYGLDSFAETVQGEESALGKVVKMVLDIVPDNLVVPFETDNDLQVIVIAIFIGVTLLLLSKKITWLFNLINECTELVNKMMMLCCKTLPVIVFFGVVKLISTSDYEQFLSIAKMLGVYLVVNFVFMASMFIRTKATVRTPLKTIFPKQIATLMINLTTSSQVAALPENMKCCKEKFGIDSKLVDFGLPLGIVVYMPSGAIYIAITAWVSSLAMGIPVTAGAMIRILIVSIILAIAAPPIPGSSIVVLPVLFASCGIPNDAFPLAVIFATIIGYILPAANGINIQLELLMTAKKLKKLDEEKLNTVSK